MNAPGNRDAEASLLFTQTMLTSWSQWGSLGYFRRIGLSGMQYVSPHLLAEFEAAIMDFKSGRFGEFRIDPRKPHDERLSEIPHQSTKKTLERFEQTLDSAALVFGHSVLDAVAHDMCRVCALVSPVSYLPYVDSRKISFSLIRTSSMDQVLSSLVADFLEQLEHESLLKKIDVLHAVCKPDPGFDPIRNYKYARDRIVILDDERHRRIHRREVLSKWDNAEAAMKYMQDTSMYLTALPNHRFDVRMDEAEFTRLLPTM